MTVTTDIDLDKYLRTINLRVYLALELLKEHGSEDQIARYARGAMPVDELLTVARAALFAPFMAIDLKRFAKSHELMRMHKQLRHAERCPELGREDAELYETSITESAQRKVLLSHEQTRNIDRLMEAVALARLHPWLDAQYLIDRTGTTEPIKVDVTMHYVACSVCQRDTHAVAAKVSIVWAEHTLVREWLL